MSQENPKILYFSYPFISLIESIDSEIPIYLQIKSLLEIIHYSDSEVRSKNNCLNFKDPNSDKFITVYSYIKPKVEGYSSQASAGLAVLYNNDISNEGVTNYLDFHPQLKRILVYADDTFEKPLLMYNSKKEGDILQSDILRLFSYFIEKQRKIDTSVFK